MICSFFSLYLGSWGALKGGERLGATMLSFGAGVSGQTLMAAAGREISSPRPLQHSVLCAPLRRNGPARGIDPRSFGFRTLFFSGEPGAGIPATKRQIEEPSAASAWTWAPWPR